MIPIQYEELDQMIPLYTAKRILALSWPKVVELVREGKLPVYQVGSDSPVDRHSVTEETHGLRIFASDLNEYIESIKVK